MALFQLQYCRHFDYSYSIVYLLQFEYFAVDNPPLSIFIFVTGFSKKLGSNVVSVVCSWNFLKFRFFPVYQQEGCCVGGRGKGKGQPRKRPEQDRGYQGKYYNPNYNRDNNYNNNNN